MGLPFKEHGRDHTGVDCWGLMRLVLAERFGIKVPSYIGDYASVSDKATIGHLIKDGMRPWRKIPADQAGAGDGVLFKILDRVTRAAWAGHIGVVIAPGWMLHVERAKETVVERYDGLRWGTRLMEIYRHEIRR